MRVSTPAHVLGRMVCLTLQGVYTIYYIDTDLFAPSWLPSAICIVVVAAVAAVAAPVAVAALAVAALAVAAAAAVCTFVSAPF